MAQKKLKRFAELKTFSNVMEYPQNMKGNWQGYFKNAHPLVLELACGRGEYTVSMAKLFPDKNFIGIDIKGNRMYIGAKKCLEENLANAAFLRTQIEMIDTYFAAGEVSEIWITFPDPQPRVKQAKKRLTHPRFLRLYQPILKPAGPIHLKTDSPDLYNFTRLVINLYGLEWIKELDDVYKTAGTDPVLSIKTYYEGLNIAQSNRVFYLQFCLPAQLPNRDEALKKILENEYRQNTLPAQGS
jgi:tRNA (guanine-N7-)-methyltransferase